MSKLSIIGLVIIAVALILFSTRSCNGFNKNRVNGSGHITIEDRPVSDFTKLSLNGVFRVIITQDGSAPSVKIEADDNVQKLIIVKNDGETLDISTKENTNFGNPGKMIVHVNVKDIRSLSNSCVGSVENQGTLKTPVLYLKTEAIGKTILHIDADSLIADLNSVGMVDLSGAATNAEIDNNSVGKLEAYKLRTSALSLKNNAVGAAEIYAEHVLNIDHNGVGAVHYKGPATITKITDNGVGKVSRAD